MSTDSPLDLPPPVDKLLRLGRPTERDVWLDYTQLGLRPEHIPDLLRLAADTAMQADDSRVPEVYGAVHAWRALGQLRAVEAVRPLLDLTGNQESTDWALEDVPQVLALIGPAAIPIIRDWLADPDEQIDSRIAAPDALKLIAVNHPRTRDECVAILAKQLEVEDRDPDLNGFIVAALLDMKAKEAAPALEKAFAEERVDESIAGDWDEVQFQLGLIEKRVKRPYSPPTWGPAPQESWDDEEEGLDDFMDDEPPFRPPLDPYGGHTPREEAEKRKKKRKAAAKARKRQRKRK
jgi:hypothetical protein